MHSYKDGQSKIPGYLDDYAFLISGLLALHEASFKQQWLEEAVSLADAMTQRFWDEGQEGQFYDTEQDHGALFVRPRDIFDSVKPCGGSAAADALLRLAIIIPRVCKAVAVIINGISAVFRWWYWTGKAA